MPRCLRSLASPSRASVLLLCSLVAAACGGGGFTLPPPFVIDAPVVGSGGPAPGATTPPPAPPLPPAWSPDAVSLSRTALFGSFPSDLVRFDDTFFTTDADAIEAAGGNVLAFDATVVPPVPSTRYAPVNIQVTDLRDSLGQPASLAVPIAFGAFLNDLIVVNARLGFVLVNAGGSDSTPTLSNLVAFDPTTGGIRQVVNLAQPYQDGTALLDSRGTPAPGGTFTQAGAEALAFVATPSGGLLYVAMSNLIVAPPSFGGHKHRGTLQVFDVNPYTLATSPVSQRPAAGLFTQTLLTQEYNPVALTAFQADRSGTGVVTPRLLVTVGGASDFDGAFNVVPVTNAEVEVYDADVPTLRGRFRMGLAGLAGTRPAIGRDARGNRVGYFPSSMTGEVYLLWLDGIYPWAIDTSELAVLRGPGNGIPITAAESGRPGGNVTGVGLSPDGRTLVVAGFGDLFAFPVPNPGQLVLLALPEDVVTGSGFGASFVPGSARYGSVSGRTLGTLLVRATGQTGPDVAILVSGAVDPSSFLGTGPASLGTLETFGLIR